ncbi:ATPase component of ABC transporters with duplicated ATPase domains [Methylophaga frappieri]|uniref:ATP-binding protein Uup n=1 Tax=Methylophaga frappieri (strain ATCC BAA-2434 / DSM 25690 / JAM7) TaxID=754477 RepID=I1YGC4_METFJ|nr:ATP-binding cassette domain-containing protein [Methylophaga frappieri]AFJ01967.1 ATPase component of ABC transporters with duplicated ATPase domains [Methylophaga frappieri]
MALLQLKQLTVSFGGPNLLENVDFQIDKGERVCLVGRNGAGKSTLMKVIAGDVTADAGDTTNLQNLKIARLEQEVPAGTQGTVFDVVAAGLGDIAPLLVQYHHIVQQLQDDASEAVLNRLEKAQHQLEAADGWLFEQQVETVISKLDLPADASFDSLSGGMKRRVLLAQALVKSPDILLLDEPTNHLDINSITWLEGFLKSYEGTVLFITHDRSFLQALATRIVWLDRGKLASFPGDYRNFLQKREAMLAAEAEQNAQFDKKLAQEEVWIRQGIKARRTRNEGRVRALQQLRRERQQRREVQGNVAMQLHEADRSGKLVAEIKAVSQSYDGKTLFDNFSSVIQRGDRVGIIGPNGCGKSTLLGIVLGKQQPQSGSVRLGTNLQVAYFDQLRSQLEENASVVDNVGQGRDFVELGDSRKHIIGYLQDFLFTPERARTPVKALSGGERNRLLLAKLFTQPANLLVMDEPTNDLDAETLELLEELLASYNGTLLLVSHDRSFLNNVVTSSIVFDDDGVVREYVGGYDDWLHQRQLASVPVKPTPGEAAQSASRADNKSKKRKSTLTYQQQLDLQALPQKIEKLEQQQSMLTLQMSQPDFYQQPSEKITALQQELTQLESELETLFVQWEALEAKQQDGVEE